MPIITDLTEARSGGVKVSTQILGWLIGWAVAGLIGYATAQNAMNARVSVLEEQFRQMHADLSDIRTDVKTLLRR